MELYRQIAACSPGCKNQILTVLEGENFGEKALFTDGDPAVGIQNRRLFFRDCR